MKNRSFADNSFMFCSIAGGVFGLYLACMSSIIVLTGLYIIGTCLAIITVYKVYHNTRFDLIRRKAEVDKIVRDSNVSTMQLGNNFFLADITGRAWCNTTLSSASHFSASGSLSNDQLENERWSIANGYVPDKERQQIPHQEMYKPQPIMLNDNDNDFKSENDLMSVDFECALVYGRRGAGKTTYLLHLAEKLIKKGDQVVVIDPKPPENEWPSGVQVIGQNFNYKDIRKVGMWISEEMKKRGNDIKNISKYPYYTLIIDEINLCCGEIQNFTDMILPTLITGRSLRMGAIWVGQSKTAKSIGLKGRFDLLQNFDALIGLKYNRNTSERSVHVDFGDGEEIEYCHPGCYVSKVSGCVKEVIQQNTHDTQGINTHTNTDTHTANDNHSEVSNKVIELHSHGLSLTAICKDAFGSRGGNQLRKVKSILKQAGKIE